MSPNASDWLLGWLADHGVEVIFGNPGSTELPFMDALARQDRIRYVLGLHEATVMGMADGYAQQGDRLSVVNVHVQPGLANALSGILNAARARVPVLVTVGQQVTSLLDQAPFLGGELVELARPIAKHALEVAAADQFESGFASDLQGELTMAVELATRHPRGPVMLSIPMDVQAGPVPDASVGIATLTRLPDGVAVDRAVALLRSASTPAILAGDGVVHEHASDLIALLAARLGAPILGEPFAARAPLPTNHPLWRGPLPGFASEIGPVLRDHDVVLAVGMPVFRLFGTSPESPLLADTQLIHLDSDDEEVGRVHVPEVGLVMSVAAGLEVLVERLGTPEPGVAGRLATAIDESDRLRQAARARMVASDTGSGIGAARFCMAIANAVDPEDLLVDEALTTGRWLRTALGGRNTPRNWLAHRGSALGWGLPAAVGAKLADASRRVMCLHGDGSFLFGVHALWTAARERLGVAVVVADNSGYEILRAGLEGLTGRSDGDWPGLALTHPTIDLVAISRGFGASAERVEHRDELPDALADVWRRAASGPAVLVVPVTGRTPAVGYPMNECPRAR